jgi:flagellar protein FlaJ
VEKNFPNLKAKLAQAEIEMPSREYAAAALISASVNAVFIFVLLALFSILAGIDMLAVAAVIAAVVGVVSFLTVVYYPQIIATRRTRRLQDNLVPAVRQLVIELKSGVPLFQALTSVCSDYGEVSEEFKKIVKRINAGEDEVEVLGEASRRIPSVQFQKVLWQISNALKVGSDVSAALESILSDLMKEKVDEIHRYGQELSPWTMIYMMAAIILPSLGITMMIVILSFLGVEVPTIVFGAVLTFLALFQLFFMNFIETRRPAL